MNCSRCGRDNPDGLKFCQDCGNRLSPPAEALQLGPPAPAAVVAARPSAADVRFASPPADKRCGRCGSANPNSGRFCANCGAALAQGAAEATASAVAPPPAPASIPVSTIALPASPPGPPPATGLFVCPRCRGSNSAPMTSCQFCGTRLSDAGAAVRPNPVVVLGGAPEYRPGTSPQFAGESGEERARLVVIGQDGRPGRQYEITGEQTDIGREEGSIILGNDPYVSPRHARLLFREGRFYIRDLESLNGVYVRLRTSERLQHADLVLVGLEVLRFEVVSDAERGLGPAAERGTQVFGSPAAPRYGRLCQRTVEGVTRDVYYPTREETVIGREVGDVVFTTDPFMSRRHAAIVRDPASLTFALKDLGSSNGTYLAIRGERELTSGDHVRIGQHLFRLDFPPGGRAR